MMLKPFRIRCLYDSSPGVVQLTTVQYDSTIRSQPEAALSYLDDDDGETILVGSSLELEQRLDEPIPPHSAHVTSASAIVEDTNSPMHTFDIKRTPASLATWREHEAYTSKALRKSPLKSPSPSNPPAILASGDRTCQLSDTLFVGNLSFDTREDTVSKAFSEYGTVLAVRLPTYHDTGNYKGFGYVTFSSVNEAKAALENMQGAEINGRACRLDFSQPSSSHALTMRAPFVPAAQGQPEPPVSVEGAIKGALQGLEAQVGAFAGFLQDASNTLRTVAETTREADTSAIGGILDGFKGIFSEVAKVGKAMVEAFDAEAFAHSPSVSLAVAEDSITKKLAIEGREVTCPSGSNAVPATGQRENTLASSATVAKAPEPSSSSTMPPTSSRVPVTDHKVLRKAGTFIEKAEEVRGGSSVQARASEAASYADEPSEKESSAPFAAYASLQDPWNISPPKRPDQDVGCNYCQIRKMHCKKNFSGGACQNCLVNEQPCSIVTGPTGSSASAWYNPWYESMGLKPNALATDGHYYPPQQLNPQQNDRVQLPRETAKTYAQPPKGTTSRSILDLENSDPDFSTRYPPLMSLRKSKTIGSLGDRSRSPFLANINPEAALSRFPSLSEIEHEARSDRRTKAPSEDQGGPTKRWSFVKDSENLERPAARPKLAIPTRTVDETGPGTPPKPPGAWPDPRSEAEVTTLPTSEESSGAFFDRMTRSRSPEPATRSFRYIPAHLRPSYTSGTPYIPRRLREPLKVDTTYVPHHLRHAISVDTMGPQLGRSKTVTASNPAARLNRPFDPLEDARQSRDTNALPRRSDSERYWRRPYNDSFTGAGRTPWESFERVPQSERPAATRHEPRPSRRDASPFKGGDQSSAAAAAAAAAAASFGIADKVGDCVRQLRDMGYGAQSPHEASRLSIYAAACNGDVEEAVEMIEEDRKAGRQYKIVGDRLGVKPFSHNERPTFGR